MSLIAAAAVASEPTHTHHFHEAARPLTALTPSGRCWPEQIESLVAPRLLVKFNRKREARAAAKVQPPNPTQPPTQSNPTRRRRRNSAQLSCIICPAAAAPAALRLVASPLPRRLVASFVVSLLALTLSSFCVLLLCRTSSSGRARRLSEGTRATRPSRQIKLHEGSSTV